jgi:hypothetical protein
MYFTVHKAASVYLRKIFEALSKPNGLKHVNYARTFWKTDFRDFETLNYERNGHIYGPLRNYAPIPGIEDFKLLLHLRDPRDVMVSLYFSVAYSHPLRDKENSVKKRAETQAIDINDFVIEKAPDFAGRYQNYVDNIVGRPNVLLVHYEELVTDFPRWLDRVVDHLDLRHGPTMKSLLNKHRVSVAREDKNRHVRQITPGDHDRKLRPETIEQLNETFRNVMPKLGY